VCQVLVQHDIVVHPHPCRSTAQHGIACSSNSRISSQLNVDSTGSPSSGISNNCLQPPKPVSLSTDTQSLCCPYPSAVQL
jgi:hypothetical protein